jgi:enolase
MPLGNKSWQHLYSSQVIANHILVSFHVAFISSLLNIPPDLFGPDVLTFVFVSHETIISALFWFLCFHIGIAVHEMGHYLRAVKVNALTDTLMPQAKRMASSSLIKRVLWFAGMFVRIPYGAFRGVKRDGLTYYPEAPFNLSVAAAGPRASRNLCLVMLPCAILMLLIGLTQHIDAIIYAGRLCLGLGFVGSLDFFLADPGKYREFRERESKAQQQADSAQTKREMRFEQAGSIKEMMVTKRMHEISLDNREKLRAPWQFRNCGMGGRHTEKEYPESNISMQEMMFVPLCAEDYEEAQMITITLQNRLKEIIENDKGARVMGIGLEGGLAPYISKDPEDEIPEQRMWRMAVQTIRDSGFVPGEDIVIAFDPALSELSNAYRKEFQQVDSVGTYFFWRGEEKVVMSREQLIDLYKKTAGDIPLVSLEDGFAEDDHEGWRLLMEELGDTLFIIGDDLVTTNDEVIERCADNGLINTALIKANQIGTLSETMVAMLTALGKGLELVVSHRSKSPNDDMEAQIALSVNALGMKTGGGANTERLLKYGAVTKIMRERERAACTSFTQDNTDAVTGMLHDLVITDIIAFEEPTNAGIPTVGVEVFVGVPNNRTYRKVFTFAGSTPLGTSAGVGEAIHLIDSVIMGSPLVEQHPGLFVEQSDHTYVFAKNVSEKKIKAIDDKKLLALWHRAQRYNGKGCQVAVQNVIKTIAPRFIGMRVADLTNIVEIDRMLLSIELETARVHGALKANADIQQRIAVMQRKGLLGMNAILSVSLAISRMIAHIQGTDLCFLLRETMKKAMAELFIDHRDTVAAMDDVAGKAVVEASGDRTKAVSELVAAMSFEDMIAVLRRFASHLREQGEPLYSLLRKYIPVYPE